MLRVAILAIALAAAGGSVSGPVLDETGAPPQFNELLQRGFALHQKGDYQRAVSVLRSAWKQQPHDYFVNLLLGIDLLRTGLPKESLPFLREAAKQKPSEEFAYEYLGEAQASLQADADAYQAFFKATQVSPHSPDAAASFVGFCLTRFADLSAQMRSSTEGLAAEYRLEALARPKNDRARIEFLEKAVALSNTPENLALLALAQIAAGNVDAGRATLQQGRNRHAIDLYTLTAEALLAAKTGDWAEAITQLNAIAERSSSSLAKMLSAWPADLRPPGEGIVTGAAESFFACLEASCDANLFLAQLPKPHAPANVSREVLYREQRWEALASLGPSPREPHEAIQQRAVALAEIGDCEHAIPQLESSLDVRNELARTMFHLSRCYAQQADRLAARQANLEGNQAVVHVMRGDVLLRLQADSKGAVAEYSAAVKEEPDDPAAWERLSEAQLSAGSPDEAKLSAKKALDLDPHRTPAVRTLAHAAMEERNYTEALPYLRELAKKNPRDLAIRVELATACSQTGALQEALENVSPALEQGYPDEKGSLHYQLGTILQRLGRIEEANKAFAAAKELSDRFQSSSLREKDAKQ